MKSDSSAAKLDLKNVGGVFFVLCVGSAFAALFGLIEWVHDIYKRSSLDKVGGDAFCILLPFSTLTVTWSTH